MIRALVVQLLLLPLRFYKAVVSPFLPPMCRFHPSCSVYAMGALAVHGPLKGFFLAARRVTRCHPFNPGGFDPVPPRNGQAAEEFLDTREPEIAARLRAPVHPSLAGLISVPTAPHREK
jgi:putative membrane protein insertion efficiency factor